MYFQEISVSASLNLTFGAHSYSLQAMSIAVARNQISGMTAASVLPSNEVSMEVGQEDVADFEAKFPGVDKVLVDIALWVDDNRGRSRLVTE